MPAETDRGAPSEVHGTGALPDSAYVRWRAYGRDRGPASHVATGVSACAPHSAQEPSKSAALWMPSSNKARFNVAAETPEPQLVTTGWLESTPASTNARRSSAAGFKVPSPAISPA